MSRHVPTVFSISFPSWVQIFPSVFHHESIIFCIFPPGFHHFFPQFPWFPPTQTANPNGHGTHVGVQVWSLGDHGLDGSRAVDGHLYGNVLDLALPVVLQQILGIWDYFLSMINIYIYIYIMILIFQGFHDIQIDGDIMEYIYIY